MSTREKKTVTTPVPKSAQAKEAPSEPAPEQSREKFNLPHAPAGTRDTLRALGAKVLEATSEGALTGLEGGKGTAFLVIPITTDLEVQSPPPASHGDVVTRTLILRTRK